MICTECHGQPWTCNHCVQMREARAVMRRHEKSLRRMAIGSALDSLATNLTVAAGYCWAFELGGHRQSVVSSFFEGFYEEADVDAAWAPGCGREAPKETP